MESRTYMTCGLKIDTTSEGWHKCLTKMLKKIQGASYTVDADGGMAYVSGKVNPRKLIRRIVKAGKEAELSWVRTGSDQYTYGNGNGYYDGVQGYDPSYIGATAPYYNYGQAGYYRPYGGHQGYYSQAPYAYNFY